MSTFLLFLSVLLLVPGAAKPAPGESSAEPVSIVVRVDGARTDDGSIVVLLFDSADGFPSDSERAALTASARINNGAATLVFDEVLPGRYAIVAFHDDDGDGVLDTNWVGKPKDGIAATNWDGGRPRFDGTAIELKGAETLALTLRYL